VSTWKRIAIENIPELRDEIQNANNPHSISFELQWLFEKSVTEKNFTVADRIMKFIKWSISNASGSFPNDIQTAAVVGLLEPLSGKPEMSKSLPRWFSLKEIQDYKWNFLYWLKSEERYQEFETYFK
jgi:hypothetical protein